MDGITPKNGRSMNKSKGVVSWLHLCYRTKKIFLQIGDNMDTQVTGDRARLSKYVQRIL
jgi:hypothetical protein